MKIKKFAVIAACSCLVFSSNAVSAHCHNGNCHYDYDYGYNYDYGHHAGHNTCINNDYDCSSHPDHAHIDGVCPYYCTDQEYQYYQASTVKKVQAKLNKAGYNVAVPMEYITLKQKNQLKNSRKTRKWL